MVDIGLWRSTRGDTHPHHGLDIDLDYQPQGTHLVWEAPLLVACVTGRGGGFQQRAMFKRDLDPLLAGALERWQRTPLSDAPTALLDYWFAEVQVGFDTLDDPLADIGEKAYDPFDAGAVALLVRDDGAALGHLGFERAWRWRDHQLAQLTRDYSFLDFIGPKEAKRHPPYIGSLPGATFRRASPGRPRLGTWQVQPIDAHRGDVFLLASGIDETTISTRELDGAFGQLFAAEHRIAGAQDLATRLGELVTFEHRGDNGVEWAIHSRLALAIVWID